jgi:hypothetical protein
MIAGGPFRRLDEELLGARRDALAADRLSEAEARIAESSPATIVYVTRFVRCAFGLGGIGAALVLLDAALNQGVALTPILDASWLVLGAVVLAARPLAAVSLGAAARRAYRASDDLPGDLAMLEGQTAERTLAGLADRLEERSVALPLAALALLLPLTLHRLAAFLLDGLGVPVPFVWAFGAARAMDAWIKASLALVGHCHVLLLVLACAFARDLRRHPDLPEPALGERAGWGAFAWTSLASIPAGTLCLALWPLEGWVPFLLVPTLVTLTGLTFIPSSFLLLGRAIARERRRLRV